MHDLTKSKAVDDSRDHARQFGSHAKAALAALPDSNAKNLRSRLPTAS